MENISCKKCNSLKIQHIKTDNYGAKYSCQDCGAKWLDRTKRIKSEKSIKREQERLHPKTVESRKRIEKFIEYVDAEIAYSIKQDLKKMTNMEFYGDKLPKVKYTLSDSDRIKKYVYYLFEKSEIEFAEELLSKLSKQQTQTLRKSAPRYGSAKDRWEHAIPVKVIVQEILKMIRSKDISEIDKLLGLYKSAGQRAVTNEEDQKLKPFKDCMPEGWNWREENVDVFARYKAVGINID